MSTQPEPDYVDEPLSEQAVRDYLAANPDFFERNAKLLGSLHLPFDQRHGAAARVRQVERTEQLGIALEEIGIGGEIIAYCLFR